MLSHDISGVSVEDGVFIGSGVASGTETVGVSVGGTGVFQGDTDVGVGEIVEVKPGGTVEINVAVTVFVEDAVGVGRLVAGVGVSTGVLIGVPIRVPV